MSASKKRKRAPRSSRRKPPPIRQVIPIFEDWIKAPQPNYITNINLQFSYSDYLNLFPLKNGISREFQSTSLSRGDLAGRIVDFWGEGRLEDGRDISGFPDSYNINHQYQLVSNRPDSGKRIPNRIPTTSYQDLDVSKYIPDDSVSTITLMGADFILQTAQEIERMISAGDDALIVIFTYEESSPAIGLLETQLDLINFVLSPLYPLSAKLQQITFRPRLCFCPARIVLQQATQLFLSADMPRCAEILCSLWRSSARQKSAVTALRNFFAQDPVRNHYFIFKLGYVLNTTSEGKNVLTKYMNSNIARIVQGNYEAVKIVSNFSSIPSYLCTNLKVQAKSWQYGFFGDAEYLKSPNYDQGTKLRLDPVLDNYEFNIQSNFGAAASLCTEYVATDSYQWAWFGTNSYVINGGYGDGRYFRFMPVDGGNKFRIQAGFGVPSYLLPYGKVTSNNYQWAIFGSEKYLKDPAYSGAAEFSLEFE